MDFCSLLRVRPGVTAVIGSGGKTTLLAVLARALTGAGRRVILTTTTHIYPFAGMPATDGDAAAVAAALAQSPAVCVGAPGPQGKLCAPALPMAALAALADYVLVEADGAHRCPLKAHAPHEPAIPPGAARVVCVAGAAGFGRPVAEAVHRPGRFAALTGAALTDPVTPALAARALNAEHLADFVFLNQVDDLREDGGLRDARAFAAALAAPCAAGSLRQGLAVPLPRGGTP